MPQVFDNCTQLTDVCTVQHTIYGYRPSLPLNALFLSIFILCALTQIALGYRYRTYTYTIALLFGCVIEAFGYVGRLLMHNNPYSDTGFKMQICCLIMGPAFLAIGIYLTLKHIVKVYGREYSYLRPKFYTWIFIICDFLSLSLQAAGGGIASGANDNQSTLDLGNNLAIAGIIMQVITLAIFAFLAIMFFTRRYLDHSSTNYTGRDPALQTKLFRSFLGAVIIAFITIFIRCVYRIPEMLGGWGNPLMQNQREFVVLDSFMCSIAAVALTVFHPGYCFPLMAKQSGFIDDEEDEQAKVAGSEKEPRLTTRRAKGSESSMSSYGYPSVSNV